MLLDERAGSTAGEILRQRLGVLGREIANLRRQQRSIMQILNQEILYKEPTVINKERWVEIMRAAGLSEHDMHSWHIQFEKMEPAAHQEFLESLGIEPAEVEQIRQWCRTA